jgi:RNA polymerase sigma factor (TIGR02999 family)
MGLPPFLNQRENDLLFSMVYERLRSLASTLRSRERHETLNSTALVHEAWLKLRDFPELAKLSPAHFKNLAARVMRRMLVDQARRRYSQKRIGEIPLIFLSLNDVEEPAANTDEELLGLDEALTRLEEFSPRQAEVVQSLYFGGMTIAETAAVLSISESSVDREWRRAKAWLAVQLAPKVRGKTS